MMLVALMNLYNERLFLPIVLRNIRRIVDRIVAVDGAYESLKKYGVAEPWSTDGTIEYLEEKDADWRGRPPIVIKTVADFWRSEVEKRNYLLSFVNEGDYAFIIDGDEVAWGLGALLRETLEKLGPDVLYIPVYSVPDTRYFPFKQDILMPRIIRMRRGIHYGDRHWHVMDGEGRVIANHNIPPWSAELPHDKYSYMEVDFFGLTNLRGLKNPRRKRIVRSYYREMGTRGWLEK